MFARVQTLSLLLFVVPLMVAATAVRRAECSNTAIQSCCQSYQAASNYADVFAAFGIAAPTSGQVGVNCIQGGCSTSQTCCSGNHFNGYVNVGCNTISSP